MVHLRIDEPSASSPLEHLACDGPSCGGSHVYREYDLIRAELLDDSACGGYARGLLDNSDQAPRRTQVK